MTPRFTDTVCLVTGSSRGIGLGIAERLVAEGARVVLTGRTAETLDKAVAALGGPGTALAIPGKGDDPEHHAAVVDAALSTFGRLDHVVANVGINPVYGSLADLDLGAARKVLEVNVLGALGLVRTAYRMAGPPGQVTGGGPQDAGTPAGTLRSVVTVASTAGLRPAPGIGFYGTSKAALLHLTQQLASELAPEVRVNAVAPSIVRTRFAEKLIEDEESVRARYPLGRIGEPADIGGPAAFLLSDDAAWMTGQTLVVDGGASLATEL